LNILTIGSRVHFGADLVENSSPYSAADDTLGIFACLVLLVRREFHIVLSSHTVVWLEIGWFSLVNAPALRRIKNAWSRTFRRVVKETKAAAVLCVSRIAEMGVLAVKMADRAWSPIHAWAKSIRREHVFLAVWYVKNGWHVMPKFFYRRFAVAFPAQARWLTVTAPSLCRCVAESTRVFVLSLADVLVEQFWSQYETHFVPAAIVSVAAIQCGSIKLADFFALVVEFFGNFVWFAAELCVAIVFEVLAYASRHRRTIREFPIKVVVGAIAIQGRLICVVARFGQESKHRDVRQLCHWLEYTAALTIDGVACRLALAWFSEEACNAGFQCQTQRLHCDCGPCRVVARAHQLSLKAALLFFARVLLGVGVGVVIASVCAFGSFLRLATYRCRCSHDRASRYFFRHVEATMTGGIDSFVQALIKKGLEVDAALSQ
jgi:hypothetical protein